MICYLNKSFYTNEKSRYLNLYLGCDELSQTRRFYTKLLKIHQFIFMINISISPYSHRWVILTSYSILTSALEFECIWQSVSGFIITSVKFGYPLQIVIIEKLSPPKKKTTNPNPTQIKKQIKAHNK